MPADRVRRGPAAWSALLLVALVAPCLSGDAGECAAEVATTPTCEMSAGDVLRGVKTMLPRAPKHWVGDGFNVRPVFGRLAFTEEISPFLMFDYAEPKEFPPRPGKKPLGVGMHPHRGFETVTIAFQGEIEHFDNTGVRDVIGPGDVQWMTASRGILHQEFHSDAFTASGGTVEMFQLWVNLPAAKKMIDPTYQPILAGGIPSTPLPKGAGDVRVIAGTAFGVTGPATTHSPVILWEVRLNGAADAVDIPVDPAHNCIAFVRSGGVDILDGTGGSKRLGSQDGAITTRGAGILRLRAADGKPASAVLMGGQPLNEPIAHQGPFVMNTYDEIDQAFSDYRSGKFGKRDA